MDHLKHVIIVTAEPSKGTCGELPVAPLNSKKEGSSEECPKTVKLFSVHSQIRGNGQSRDRTKAGRGVNQGMSQDEHQEIASPRSEAQRDNDTRWLE